MGVDRSDYIVYGWKLPYKLKNIKNEEIDFYKCLSMIEGWPSEKYSIVTDGMSGQYSVFGLRIQSCHDEYEGWDFVELDFKNLDAEKVKLKYKEVFEMEPETEPKLLIFSKFS